MTHGTLTRVLVELGELIQPLDDDAAYVLQALGACVACGDTGALRNVVMKWVGDDLKSCQENRRLQLEAIRRESPCP